MSLPRVSVPAYRAADVRVGDTIQWIAARELGDASRWAELVTFNRLLPPYIVSDPLLASSAVLAPGDEIKIPAPGPFVAVARSQDDVFLSDARLTDKRLSAADGDFSLVAGVDNLAQALNHAIITPRGDLPFHPEYGSKISSLIGGVSSPVATIMAAQYAQSVIEADERIYSVTRSEAAAVGDSMAVEVDAVTIYGRPINLQVSV